MGFWVGVNTRNSSKSGLFEQKVGVYSRNIPKTGLFNWPSHINWGFIQEWGCNIADTVFNVITHDSIVNFKTKVLSILVFMKNLSK